IFEGEKGCGKKMLAAAFSKILQCQAESGRPCGKCSSCIQMDHRNHPDVIWVTHEKANVISVGEIRNQVVNTIDISPYKGPYKIYIIDEAEKMNTQAQNAILKTIEEPMDYAVIFLLTNSRGAFLPTILSRCITMSVKPVPDYEIRRYLMEHGKMDEGMADFYAGFAMGNLGRALRMAGSPEFNQMREQVFRVLKSMHEWEIFELDDLVKQSKGFKDQFMDYLDMIRMWFRDILVWKTTKDREKIEFSHAFPVIQTQEPKLSLEAIGQIFDRINRTEQQIRANVNYEPSLDLLFIFIRRCFQ
ncbi:MAG: AAA family ATPase, partial [Eubacterium sp.]|nr:AAA family ATPase [Eubacterium sp.]